MNTQLGTPEVEATPATDLPRFQVEDWVSVRPQTISFADLLGMFLKVVAVEARPPQMGSYVADVETPDGERRRGNSGSRIRTCEVLVKKEFTAAASKGTGL
jgi:hypothetical protein